MTMIMEEWCVSYASRCRYQCLSIRGLIQYEYKILYAANECEKNDESNPSSAPSHDCERQLNLVSNVHYVKTLKIRTKFGSSARIFITHPINMMPLFLAHQGVDVFSLLSDWKVQLLRPGRSGKRN